MLDLIRNKPVDLAAAILKHTPKAACEDLEKLLKSAVANAENNFNMDRNSLYVAAVLCNAGPDSEADPSQRPRPGVPGAEENLSHHHCGEGKRVSGKEAKIWVRK